MKKSDSRGSRSTAGQFVAASRKTNSRKVLAKATGKYFKSLSAEAAAEEDAIARNLASAVEDLDFGKKF